MKENKGLIIKILISISIILFLSFFGKSIFNRTNKTTEILGIRKVLFNSYDNINCLDTSCKSIIALKQNNVSLLNEYGQKVFKYEKDSNEIPKEVTDNYYITYFENEYYIKDSEEKILFKTNNELKSLNDKYVMMKNNSKYFIIDEYGKIIFKNLSDIKKYDKFIEITDENNTYILDNDLDKVLTNYKISKLIYDNEELKYMIIYNHKNNLYNYYSVSSNKIIENPFVSYTYQNENIYIKNKDDIYFKLQKNGKQVRITLTDNIKNKFSKNYNIYDESIYDSKQRYVLADNKKDNSIGILDLKKDKYKKLYKYKVNKNIKSNVSILNFDELILKITCSNKMCDSNKTIIYDIENNEQLFKIDKIIDLYNHYDNDYKVIHTDKYIVFDDNNKQIFKSDRNLAILGQDLIIGNLNESPLFLYSIKNNNIFNKDGLSYKKFDDKIIYTYSKDNNIIYLNNYGEEVINIKNENYIKSYKDNYIYLIDDYVKIYNVKKDATYKYKLSKGEKIKNLTGQEINPFNNAIFINNDLDNYVKVINFKGSLLTKINNVNLYQVIFNNENYKAYIITKNNDDKYGLYIAE